MSMILGVDPGLARLGWAVVELLPAAEHVVEVGTIATSPTAKKRGIRVADDDVHRCRTLAGQVLALIDEHHAVALAVELPSGSRGARAAAALGMAKALVAAVAEARALPIASCSPVELKRAVCDDGGASKDDVRAALERRYGALTWPQRKGDVEHAADALGAVVACLDADVLRMARRVVA